MGDKRLEMNRKAWDLAAESFRGRDALPIWGPFAVGRNDPSLIGPIRGKKFLEIACGSGHSLSYLSRRGAKRVYGLDFSKAQIDFANEQNRVPIRSGRVQLFHSAMEERVPLKNLDVVYSIFGIGWTVDPAVTFRNIFSYLKPGGRFVWSWDHSLFKRMEADGKRLWLKDSYHDEHPFLQDWKNHLPVHRTERKISTWFSLLRDAGFEIERYLEPAPITREATEVYRSKSYKIAVAKLVPCTIIFDCRKPN